MLASTQIQGFNLNIVIIVDPPSGGCDLGIGRHSIWCFGMREGDRCFDVLSFKWILKLTPIGMS
jgi:hypothetical protein